MGSIYDSGDRYRNDRPEKAKVKAKKPEPVQRVLWFSEFSGKKVTLKDSDNVRFWIKLSDFHDFLEGNFTASTFIVDFSMLSGLSISGYWLTEKKGTSYLTRPYFGDE